MRGQKVPQHWDYGKLIGRSGERLDSFPSLFLLCKTSEPKVMAKSVGNANCGGLFGGVFFVLWVAFFPKILFFNLYFPIGLLFLRHSYSRQL